MKEMVLIKEVTNTSKRRIFIKNKNHFQNDDDDVFDDDKSSLLLDLFLPYLIMFW